MALKRSASLGVCSALFLSGCALFGGSTPLDTYDLSTPSSVAAARRSHHLQILVAEPAAIKSFDGQNIVIKPSPGVIEYLKGAQWADRLPKVVQARLIDALQRSGRFAGVGKPGEGLAIDYQVITDIRAFDIVASGTAHAEVSLFVRLLNDRNGAVKTQKLFTADAPVIGTGNGAFVKALDRAFDKAASDIVSWSASVL
ncbi:MAG TPA: ABC-type transport auxiliary lipoprotein family protein [Rhizobiaceae bacterium]|nr:ABC-type transport auxiliary lipoprotein family protein [Rhizobiaceae bacterium]